jgi:hypothetical protein
MKLKEEVKVIIEEVLSRCVEVEADNEAEALKIVNKQYDNSDIVLTADDYVETDIYISKEED